MAVYTEAQLRHMFGTPRFGMRIELPADARFSPAAADFLKEWRIEVEVGVVTRTPHTRTTTAGRDSGGSLVVERPLWDRNAEFPVVKEGKIPQCVLCGSAVTHKPEHMTQLNADSFAAKNSPRIRFRGKMDSLNALTMLVAARARALGANPLVEPLGTVAAYCREIMSAEYHDRPVAPIFVAGLDADAIRNATHDPAGVLGVAHLTPTVADGELLHWLNTLRTQVREAEIMALDAFAPTADHPIVAPDLIRAVNRLSSAVYLIELLFVRGDLAADSAPA